MLNNNNDRIHPLTLTSFFPKKKRYILKKKNLKYNSNTPLKVNKFI